MAQERKIITSNANENSVRKDQIELQLTNVSNDSSDAQTCTSLMTQERILPTIVTSDVVSRDLVLFASKTTNDNVDNSMTSKKNSTFCCVL